MRRTAVPLLLTALVLLLWPAAPASAGGPTSVLISVPGEGRVAALSWSDSAYDRLAAAVGVGQEPTAARHDPDLGSQTPITLTWLIHDVTPWRLDRVYLHEGATYVLTQESPGGGSLTRAEPILHRVGPELMGILEAALPEGRGDDFAAAADDPEPAPAAPTPEPRAEGQPEVTAAASSATVSPVLAGGIGLGGLLVGVLGTLAALAVRRPRERSDDSLPSTHDQLVWP